LARIKRKQVNQASVLKHKSLKELLQKQKLVSDSKAKRQEQAETSNVGAHIRVCWSYFLLCGGSSCHALYIREPYKPAVAWLSGSVLVLTSEVTLHTGMGDHLCQAYHLGILASHPRQLSLLPQVEWEISTGQKAVMSCGWSVKASMAHFTYG